MLDLRKERKRKGLSLDQVANRTRIPRRYLAALEEGDTHVLPEGPFRQGYLRQYLDELGLSVAVPTRDIDSIGDHDPYETYRVEQERQAAYPAVPAELPLDDEPTGDPEPSSTIPKAEEIPVVRLVVTGFVLTLVAVLGLRLGSQFLDNQDAPLAPTAVTTTPQHVKVRAIEPTQVRLVADGEVQRDGLLPAGESVEADGASRIEVDLSDLTTVVVYHDDRRVEPLHNLSTSRRLVFIQDPAE